MRLRKRMYRIYGETASQKNSQTFSARSRTMVKSAAFRKWIGSALTQIKRQGIPSSPYAYAEIRIRFTHSDLRRRDGDNALSSVQDLLVKAGVIEDDCWTRIGTPRVEHDVGALAFCDIEIAETAPPEWKSSLEKRKGRMCGGERPFTKVCTDLAF